MDQLASNWAALNFVVIVAILIDELTSDWASANFDMIISFFVILVDELARDGATPNFSRAVAVTLFTIEVGEHLASDWATLLSIVVFMARIVVVDIVSEL